MFKLVLTVIAVGQIAIHVKPIMEDLVLKNVVLNLNKCNKIIIFYNLFKALYILISNSDLVFAV